MPKWPVIKELGFIQISIVVIVIFAYLKKTGYPFFITYMVLYACYLIITIYLD